MPHGCAQLLRRGTLGPVVPRVRRGFVVLALLGSAGSCLVVLTLPWLTALAPPTPGSPARIPQELSGTQCLPAGQALALVGAAAGIGLLTTRSWGIRLVAGIASLTGLALLVLAARFAVLGPSSVLPTESVVVMQSSWWLIVALSGLLMATLAVAALLVAPGWQHSSTAYDRVDDASRGANSAKVGEQGNRAAIWDALDRGEDPSAGDPR